MAFHRDYSNLNRRPNHMYRKPNRQVTNSDQNPCLYWVSFITLSTARSRSSALGLAKTISYYVRQRVQFLDRGCVTWQIKNNTPTQCIPSHLQLSLP